MPTRLLRALVLSTTLAVTATASANPCEDAEGRWQTYKQRFLQNDGRIIDLNDTGKSTSEGQAYGLFHALVANDRESFNSILKWLQNNLSAGDLGNRLPGWKWGQQANGEWGLLEENSASDADVWIAYSLLEASRLWNQDDYRVLGLKLLAQVKQQEVETAKGLGPVLLPGPHGFKLSSCQWRLNPSYLPIQLFRGLAAHDPQGPWQALAESSLSIIKGSSPKGVAPDWIVYDPSQGFIPDPQTGDKGSYDAIRVYLWAGMLHNNDPLSPSLKESLKFQCSGDCWPPTETRTSTGIRYGEGPAGFKAAVLPWLQMTGQQQCEHTTRAALKQSPVGNIPNYYDENLKLFALGWVGKAYHFDLLGHLQPAWKDTCS